MCFFKILFFLRCHKRFKEKGWKFLSLYHNNQGQLFDYEVKSSCILEIIQDFSEQLAYRWNCPFLLKCFLWLSRGCSFPLRAAKLSFAKWKHLEKMIHSCDGLWTMENSHGHCYLYECLIQIKHLKTFSLSFKTLCFWNKDYVPKREFFFSNGLWENLLSPHP